MSFLGDDGGNEGLCEANPGGDEGAGGLGEGKPGLSMASVAPREGRHGPGKGSVGLSMASRGVREANAALSKASRAPAKGSLGPGEATPALQKHLAALRNPLFCRHLPGFGVKPGQMAVRGPAADRRKPNAGFPPLDFEQGAGKGGGRRPVRANRGGDVCGAAAKASPEKSQRDLIIQPSVDAMPSRLRWVANQNDLNPEGVASLRAKR